MGGGERKRGFGQVAEGLLLGASGLHRPRGPLLLARYWEGSRLGPGGGSRPGTPASSVPLAWPRSPSFCPRWSLFAIVRFFF